MTMNTGLVPSGRAVSCTRCGRMLAQGLICICCQSLLLRQHQDASTFRRDQGLRPHAEYDRLRTSHW